MNRRRFLSLLGLGVAGVVIEQAIPLGRVWSFPKEIVVASPVSVRFVRAYAPLERLMMARLDVLYGFGELAMPSAVEHATIVKVSHEAELAGAIDQMRVKHPEMKELPPTRALVAATNEARGKYGSTSPEQVAWSWIAPITTADRSPS